MADKLTKLESRTLAAEGSFDPFDTPPVKPMRLVSSDSKKLKAPEPAPQPTPAPEPVKAQDPEPTPEPVAEQSSFEVTETLTENDGPKYQSNWRGREVMIAVPVYKSLNPGTAMAITALTADFGLDKVRLEYEFGGAFVDAAKANIAAKFLASGASWLLMLDDDIFPAFGRPAVIRSIARLPATVSDEVLGRNILTRLLSTNQRLVGAAYFGRTPDAPLLSAGANLYTDAAKQHQQGTFPVDWVGGGCLLVHKDVFTAIRATHPELTPTDGSPYPYFRRNGNESEDVSFCARARKAGVQPFLDTSVPVYHYGGHFYGGGTL